MYQIKDKYLLSVVNRDQEIMFNIFDKNGNIHSYACFRIWPQVAKELNIKIDELDNYEVVHIGEIAKQISHV